MHNHAGYFLTKIFHPNVSVKGEICVNVLKRDWKPDLGIKHVLQVVRCLLIEPFPESALNEEAGKLLLEDYESYAKHARLMTRIHAASKSGNSAAAGEGGNASGKSGVAGKCTNIGGDGAGDGEKGVGEGGMQNNENSNDLNSSKEQQQQMQQGAKGGTAKASSGKKSLMKDKHKRSLKRL